MRTVGSHGWRRTAVVGLLVGAVAVAALAAPAAAAAKPKSGAERLVPLFTGFTLTGANGYTVEVLAVGGYTLLHAASGKVSATYGISGKAVRDGIEARFGKLGRISVRYREVGPRRRRAASRCRPTRQVEFRGTIRFRGERGYTEVRARRARGFVLGFPVNCREARRSRAAGGQPAAPKVTTHLHGISKRRGRTASISALRFTGHGRLYVQASLEERRGAMTIARSALALVGGRNAFVASGPGKHPAFAILRPPKPFSGNGVFEETGAFSSAWTGSLAAWLPGAGKVHFAGPRFSSSYCRRPATARGCALSPTVRRPLAALFQESGSQSQAAGDARLSWSR